MLGQHPQSSAPVVSAPPGGRSSFADHLLARLARVTSSGQLIPEIDGLRFFAIISVVLFHLNWYYQQKMPLETPPGNDPVAWSPPTSWCPAPIG